MGQRKDRFSELVRKIEQDSLCGQNYEYLGDYYLEENKEKAYLCYENALFFGGVEEGAVKEKIRTLEQENINKHKVSIVLLSYNAKDMMMECVESIRRNNPPCSYEMVVVDNASWDGVVDWLKEQNDIVLWCNEENVGFPRGCNQGIRLAEKDNDIMLLNNDTIVTENALFWLRMALCESQMGASGSISNMTEKVSTTLIGKETRTKEEQLQSAKHNNVLLEHPYQKSLCLVGYAMLIKREALEQTGYLDENFSPGNFEDNDISFRLIQNGYQLVMCYNSFIFHYGSSSFKKEQKSYLDLLTRNFYLFHAKYGFDVDYYTRQRDDLLEHLPEDRTAAFRLLDIGCGCGSTLFRIEGLYPSAEVVGVEKCVKAVEIGSKISKIYALDIEKQELPFEKQSFDYIILGNVLEQLEHPLEILRKVRDYLKPDGKVIASIYNHANIKNAYQLLQGIYPETERYGLWDRQNRHCFTGESIVQLFQNSQFQIKDITYLENKLSEEEEQFLKQTQKMANRMPEELLRAYNYIVIAGK